MKLRSEKMGWTLRGLIRAGGYDYEYGKPRTPCSVWLKP